MIRGELPGVVRVALRVDRLLEHVETHGGREVRRHVALLVGDGLRVYATHATANEFVDLPLFGYIFKEAYMSYIL